MIAKKTRFFFYGFLGCKGLVLQVRTAPQFQEVYIGTQVDLLEHHPPQNPQLGAHNSTSS